MAGQGSQRVKDKRTPIPLQVNGIDDDRIGLIYNQKTQSDAIVIKGSGSSISSVDIHGQFAYHGQIAEAIKRVASVAGLSVGVSFVFRRRPESMVTLDQYLIQNIHPKVAAHTQENVLALPFDSLTPEDKRWRNLALNLLEQRQLIEAYGRRPTMAAVLTIRRSKQLQRASQGKSIAESDYLSEPIVNMANLMVDALEQADVSDLEILDVLGIQAYMREAFDVNGLDDYTERVSEAADDDDLSTLHWPSCTMSVTQKTFTADDTHHATLILSQAAKLATPYTLRQLFSISASYPSIATVGETVSGSREYAVLDQAIPIISTIREMLGNDRTGPRAAAREQARQTRQEELYSSIYKQNYNILIGLAHTNREQLEKEVGDTIRDVRSYGFNVRRIRHASLQAAATISVTTGINML